MVATMSRGPKQQEELRAHPRISAPARAFLISETKGRVELPVRDVSRGGIFLFTPEGLMQVGEEVQLEVGLPDGSFTLQLWGLVVRQLLAPKGEAGVGLKFVRLTPEIDERLVDLLRRLIDGGGGKRRAYPRISHRVSVWCTGSKEVRALLKDLSLGGAGLWLDTPLAVEEQVTMQLHRADGSGTLELKARVVSTRWAMDDDPYDQAGVEFVDLNDSQRNALKEYLNRLLGL